MIGSSTEPRFRAAVCCETGRRRANNEDNFYLDGRYKPLSRMDEPASWGKESGGAALYAVCDGMGGADGGELAATLAVTALDAVAPRLRAAPENTALAAACLCEIGRQARTQALRLGNGMGTTLVLALVHAGGAELYNLGDSRAYLLQNGRFAQVSRDHTAAQSFSDMGMAPQGPNYLTQYLGMDEEVDLEPHHVHIDLLPGSRLLLCSDGLTDMLDDGAIAVLLSAAGPAPALAEDLVRSACAAGGRDNVTALVVEAG